VALERGWGELRRRRCRFDSRGKPKA